MIRHILTLIWNQRRSNVWIFLELLLVAAILWVVTDALVVDLYTYHRPLGLDTRNTYVVNINRHVETADSLQRAGTGEDMLTLVSRLRQCPEVEAAGIGMWACPYVPANAYRVFVSETDTTAITEENTMSNVYHYLIADIPYFQVFHFRTKQGQPLAEELRQHPGDLVISADVEQKFFGKESGQGKRVKNDPSSTNTYQIAAISSVIRYDDFTTDDPRLYRVVRTDQDWVKYMKSYDISQFQCFLRMKKAYTEEEMEQFLQSQGERLEAGNLYVSSVQSVRDFRDSALKEKFDAQKKQIALTAFMLVNIFFGIVGTFWLRTQSRRAEIGLRAAMGASKRRLCGQLYGEGLWLLLLTMPFVLLILLNLLALDIPDTYRLAYTGWRFVLAFGGTYVLLGLMIYLGISIPAKQILRMNPADTLHYE